MLRRIEDAEVDGKRVLVRVDFNVPMREGQVTDDTRLKAALPTIAWLRSHGAKVILAAHFGRPKGAREPDMSLRPVLAPLSELLATKVLFAEDCVGESAERAAKALQTGDVLLLENTRFHAGEEANDPEFAARLAGLADLYVNDAFSAAHRAHASTEGVAHHLPAYAGKAMEREIDHLTAALEAPTRPLLAVVGGAKVSTKLDLLKNLVSKVDRLFVGGAMANTFLAAKGHDVGASLHEADLLTTAREILDIAGQSDCDILLPVDGVVTKEFKAHAERRVAQVDDIKPDEMMLDCGPDTVDRLADAIAAARTLVWNGPLGAFETPPFDTATVEAANFAAGRARNHNLVAVAGGGDTVAALNHAGVAEDFTFVSTAGGAFLEWLEGKTLPGVAVLKED
ncbi:phosphoglycerate kinase [Marinicauda pacifica]|uniref:Phosphoglycerate kinase n=1 Tax=Marinicauda pacifica TaxID=1133559 RepID=A0A4S2HAU6_9PROT|nr:phosphoglycerate kinase [Marinicauda pacifica]TGY93055.1 phosphoglycerate kinase [Marinicauda pacifica]GGE42422.1 phosphoglycerate kinase [Marinicauda pacifica]